MVAKDRKKAMIVIVKRMIIVTGLCFCMGDIFAQEHHSSELLLFLKEVETVLNVSFDFRTICQKQSLDRCDSLHGILTALHKKITTISLPEKITPELYTRFQNDSSWVWWRIEDYRSCMQGQCRPRANCDSCEFANHKQLLEQYIQNAEHSFFSDSLDPFNTENRKWFWKKFYEALGFILSHEEFFTEGELLIGKILVRPSVLRQFCENLDDAALIDIFIKNKDNFRRILEFTARQLENASTMEEIGDIEQQLNRLKQSHDQRILAWAHYLEESIFTDIGDSISVIHLDSLAKRAEAFLPSRYDTSTVAILNFWRKGSQAVHDQALFIDTLRTRVIHEFERSPRMRVVHIENQLGYYDIRDSIGTILKTGQKIVTDSLIKIQKCLNRSSAAYCIAGDFIRIDSLLCLTLLLFELRDGVVLASMQHSFKYADIENIDNGVALLLDEMIEKLLSILYVSVHRSPDIVGYINMQDMYAALVGDAHFDVSRLSDFDHAVFTPIRGIALDQIFTLDTTLTAAYPYLRKRLYDFLTDRYMKKQSLVPLPVFWENVPDSIDKLVLRIQCRSFEKGLEFVLDVNRKKILSIKTDISDTSEVSLQKKYDLSFQFVTSMTDIYIMSNELYLKKLHAMSIQPSCNPIYWWYSLPSAAIAGSSQFIIAHQRGKKIYSWRNWLGLSLCAGQSYLLYRTVDYDQRAIETCDNAYLEKRNTFFLLSFIPNIVSIGAAFIDWIVLQ